MRDIAHMLANNKVYIIALLISIIFVFYSKPGHAQWSWDNRYLMQGDGVVMGGLGFSRINGQNYLLFNLRTDLAFGQFGLGVDIPLRVNTDTGKIRNEDWNTTEDYLRTIRYARYGRKRQTPVYARVGSIGTAKLGHGFIMNYYTNEAEFQNRKIGSEFDLKFRMFGLETVVSNYKTLEIIGGRANVRPLRNIGSLGLLSKLTFGGTYITDRSEQVSSSTDSSITISGLDVELPLLYTGPFFSHIYADYARIHSYGSGKSIGIELGLWKLSDLLTVSAKVERRFLGTRFLPSYFDAFYEVQRFRNTEDGVFYKADFLNQITEKQKGFYGELFGHVARVIRLLGTFEKLDGVPHSGQLHLAAMLAKFSKFSGRAVYDRTGIDTFGDVFKLDERSMLRMGLGYQLNSMLYIFMDYIWTFKVNPVTQRLETEKRFEPQLSLVVPL